MSLRAGHTLMAKQRRMAFVSDLLAGGGWIDRAAAERAKALGLYAATTFWQDVCTGLRGYAIKLIMAEQGCTRDVAVARYNAIHGGAR